MKRRPLRSQAWFGGDHKDAFIHRSWMKNRGLPDDAFDGRPVIGICNTFSELTPCNAHFRDLAQEVKNGVLEAGGLPLEFPVFSCGESNLRPTAMLHRNLASMDVEEAIRSNPIDGVVLLCGCDKTTPSLVMGAASCDLPAMVVSGGPMLNGRWRGRTLGSGTDVWKLSEDMRAGVLPRADFVSAESGMSRSAGHCMTMGTASTMACVVEALGLTLAGNAAYPAVDARRARLARLSGRRIVDLVREDVPMSRILTRGAFENAIRMVGAIGGSTNAVVHLLAIAGRVGVPLTLDDWDRVGRGVPTIVDLMPSGRFLMEEFCYAGGVPAAMRTLRPLFDPDCLTVSGETMGRRMDEAEVFDAEVIRSPDRALTPEGGLAVLRGNLCPDGAILKPSAASPHLMRHTGRAVAFEDIDDLKARLDDPALAIDETSVMVLKNSGPIGYPGMAEVGNMPLPKRLLEKGVRDMVRISDARMSGTAFGTVVLHVAPEAAAGGPLAAVETGDLVTLDVPARRLHLHLDDAALARRRAAAPPPRRTLRGGYESLYVKHVTQADTGADFDFLIGRRGADVPRESH
jgi:dihydroxy-acid dehydratase